MLTFDYLQHSTTLFVTVCVVLGLLVGSFLNVVIHRLPKMMEREWHQNCAELNGQEVAAAPAYNLVVPRSACPACARPIRAHENLPVISYLLLRGRCAGCQSRISIRYPLVELLTGVLSGLTAAHFGYGLQAAAALLLIWALVALTFIDFDTQYLPDDITQPLLWLGLLVNIPGTFTSLQAAVIGATAGYLSLWSVYWAFKLLTGKEGMGYGDFKLLAALGAWLGWSMLPIVILLSSLVGAIVGFALILIAKRGKDVPIPFGPYLAGGGLIALFAGQRLVRLYLGGF
jgi:leader peptidase (prepilin peptidase) / N-methyltransferase